MIPKILRILKELTKNTKGSLENDSENSKIGD